MLIGLLTLLSGLALIVKGGDWFVTAAVRIAELLRMPRVVIGATLVALATTLPELSVGVMSGLRGESDLALGNAVGSVICNIGLILGLTAVMKNVTANPLALRRPLLAMFALGGMTLLMALDLRLSRYEGLALLTCGVVYFVVDFLVAFRNREPADVREASRIEKDLAVRRGFFKTAPGTAVLFVSGAVLVVAGSRLLVDGAIRVAGLLGIPPIVIGLTLVAVGTSFPELVTAVTSSRKNVSDLSVGNILGANVANLSLVVGAAALIQNVKVDRSARDFSLPAMLVFMTLILVFLVTGKPLSRREGFILLGAYGIYVGAVAVLSFT
jgi:cation:H+ antiporter